MPLKVVHSEHRLVQCGTQSTGHAGTHQQRQHAGRVRGQQRRQPPPIGSVVTYRFRGTTGSGLPRFATYLRVREDMALNGPPAPR